MSNSNGDPLMELARIVAGRPSSPRSARIGSHRLTPVAVEELSELEKELLSELLPVFPEQRPRSSLNDGTHHLRDGSMHDINNKLYEANAKLADSFEERMLDMRERYGP